MVMFNGCPRPETGTALMFSFKIEEVSGKRTVCTFPSRCAVHSPTLSGVRVTVEMGDYVKTLYEVPGPLIVIEDGTTFLGLTWEPWNPRIGHTKPDIEINEGKWKITFPEGAKVRSYPVADSLEESVSYYRSEHSKSPAPGMAVLKRIQRCIFLDLWLDESHDGRMAHNYADVIRLLRELECLNISEGTLLYLPGWHAPYDTNMPAWEPAEALGGCKKFRELVELSKKVGAVIMPHFNYWGYNPASGLLDNWQEAWTGGGWGEKLKYMQIDHPRWIALFDKYFDTTVSEFGLEAVFLDQCGNAFDSPKGDLITATRGLLERIHRKFPDLLLGAEVLSEHIAEHVSLIQAQWLWYDNIGKFSPIARLMFKGRVRFFPHLFLGAAVPCRYAATDKAMQFVIGHGIEKVFYWYQENNRQLGGIPSVRLDYARSGIDPVSRSVL